MLCIGHRKEEKTVYWRSLATFLIKSKEESIYGIHQLHFIHFAAIYIGLSRWLRIQRIRERGNPRQNFVRDLLGDGMYLLDTQLQRSSQINSHGLSGGCCRRGERRGQMGQILSRSGRVKGEARKCQGGRCVRRGGLWLCYSCSSPGMHYYRLWLSLTAFCLSLIREDANWQVKHIKRTWRISKLTCRPFLWHLGLAILSCPTPAAFHAWTTQLLSGRIHLDEVFEPASWS